MVVAMTQKIAYGQCWTCPEWFWYGVLTVPSVPVDRAGRAVHDDGGTQVYRLAPICPKCVGSINRERAAKHLALIVADTAQVPTGHLGPLDLPDVTVQRPEWFVPTNGLPIPAHLVDCFDPDCRGCFAQVVSNAQDDAQDDAFLSQPLSDDEDTKYERTVLNPVAGLPAAIAAVPVRCLPTSAEPLLLPHTLTSSGAHAAYCACRPGDPRYAADAGLFRCLCGRSNPHAVTEACR